MCKLYCLPFFNKILETELVVISTMMNYNSAFKSSVCNIFRAEFWVLGFGVDLIWVSLGCIDPFRCGIYVTGRLCLLAHFKIYWLWPYKLPMKGTGEKVKYAEVHWACL